MNRPVSGAKVLCHSSATSASFGMSSPMRPESFHTFNEFFYRRLKPGARPVDPMLTPWCFLRMAATSAFRTHQKLPAIFVTASASISPNCSATPSSPLVIPMARWCYRALCPVDYHRFIFPLAGRVSENPGCSMVRFYSVNPIG